MGGDYEKFQQALTTPGQISAQQAYESAIKNLERQMGGRGLYGSTMMANTANEGANREYMNALASNAANAAAQRYAMEQSDLARASAQDLSSWQSRLSENQNLQGLLSQQGIAQNAFAQDIYGKKLGQESELNKFAAQMAELDRQQNLDYWKSALTGNESQNAYKQNQLAWNTGQANQLTDWANKKAYEQYQYEQARNSYQNQIDEMLMNRALALAGKGAPLTAAQMQASAAQQAAQQQSAAATTGALASAAGTLGGGLMNSDKFMTWLGGLFGGGSGPSGAVSL